MGGFFAPDPPATPAPIVLPPVVNPDAAAAQERLDAIERNRRGLLGTIATSENGVLQTQASVPVGKTLLGE
ncbi:MAG: hypothetical protein HY055_00320 [Magnetospirillum sp.]|nr:hypothetical protein [Magnetospirillum sp.]